jgi:hypothetical protein
MNIQERMKLCDNSISETFEQIKTLQSRHQQLIGYRQALLDLLSDMEEKENLSSLEEATQGIDPQKKRKAAA